MKNAPVFSHVSKEDVLATRQEPNTRQLHVELGSALADVNLYVTNMCDQRQPVVVESYNAGVKRRTECRWDAATNRRVS